MSDDFYKPLNAPADLNRERQKRGGSSDHFEVVRPAPENAPPPPIAHPQLGEPSMHWTYRAADGRPIMHVLRFDLDGKKEFRPVSCYRDRRNQALSWRFDAGPSPRPLFNLDKLASHPDATVVVVEGEKCAAALSDLDPDYAATTSLNGAQGVKHADWSPVAGRNVIVWRDNDEPGEKYEAGVIEAITTAGGTVVSVIEPPVDTREKWDAANAVEEGWSRDRIIAFLKAARPIGAATAPQASKVIEAAGRFRRGRKSGSGEEDISPTRREQQGDFISQVLGKIRLWSANAVCWVQFPHAGHWECAQVTSAAFKAWLTLEAMNEAVVSPSFVESVTQIVSAKAFFVEGPEPWLRSGERGGRIYIDLGDPSWRAIEIDGKGWRIIEGHDLPFRREPGMLAMPEPEAGYEIDHLRRFLSVSDADFTLIVAWLLSALRPIKPYVVLVVNGEAGSGKSSQSELLRNLVDPHQVPTQGDPTDERNFVLSASNARIVALDNLDAIPRWLSNSICRLSTGAGFKHRRMGADSSELLIYVARPVIINGIPDLVERPDLAERALTIRMRRISEKSRRPLSELMSDWEAIAPRVLGCLLDGVSRGLCDQGALKIEEYPRMADFFRWALASLPGVGIDRQDFIDAMADNGRNLREVAFEADPFCPAVERFIRESHPRGWAGTATKLLAELNLHVDEATRRLQLWPKTGQSVGNRIERTAELFRRRGLSVERIRQGGERIITIMPMHEEAE